MKKLLLLVWCCSFICISLYAQKHFSGKTRISALKPGKPDGFMKGNNETQAISSPFEKKEPGEQQIKLDSTYSFPWIAVNNSWSTVPTFRNTYRYDNLLRNTDQTVYRWDETKLQFINQAQYSYVYDNNGNPTEWIENDWDETMSKWIPYEHDTLIYQNNVLLSESWYFYNKINDTWFLGYSWQYNSNGALLSTTSIYWNYDTFVVEEGIKESFTLNPHDLPLVYLTEKLDTLNHVWVNYFKTESTYQNDTLLTGELMYDWDSSIPDWVMSQQNLYTYAVNLQVQTSQLWDGTTWTNYMRQTNEYNSNHKLIRYLYQIWNTDSWYDYSQTLYTYNSSNLLTDQLYQNWNNIEWVDYRLYHYAFDENLNQIEKIYKKWDMNTGLLTGSSYRYSYTYDPNQHLSSNIYQRWDVTSVDWLNNTNTAYYYSIHHLFTNELAGARSVTIFPNPASNTVFVDNIPSGTTVNIYDTWGKLAMSRRIINGQLDVSKLGSGLYFIKFRSGNETFVTRFVKESHE